MTDEKNTGWKSSFFIAVQHILTMVPASMAVPLIFGNSLGLSQETTALLVSANFFANGIAILVQSIGLGNHIGGKLPLFFGASFVPLAPMIVIAEERGLAGAFGAAIGSAAIMYILSFKIDKILKFFPKVVVGSFVTLIGLSLAPIAMNDLAGGIGSESYGSVKNIAVGFIVFIIVIVLGKFGSESLKPLSLIAGMVSGTAVSIVMGMTDMSSVEVAPWIQVIEPLFFGMPRFEIGPIAIMTVFSVVNMIQCFGALSVLDEVLGRDTDDETKIKAMRAQIVSQGAGGVFGGIPTTVFNENIGLMDITGVSSRRVTVVTGITLIVVGIVPKISSLMTVIPKPVLGGVTLALFGIIISAGISILSTVDFSNKNNLTIAGTSIAIGVGANFADGAFVQLPDTISMLFGNGLFMASISAIIMNALLNREEREVK